MKIYRLYGAMDLRLEQAPTPKPGPGEVQLRTAYVGICGSDMPRLLHGKGVPFFPATLGHEFSAVVTEVGPGVSNVRPATMSSLHPIRMRSVYTLPQRKCRAVRGRKVPWAGCS